MNKHSYIQKGRITNMNMYISYAWPCTIRQDVNSVFFPALQNDISFMSVYNKIRENKPQSHAVKHHCGAEQKAPVLINNLIMPTIRLYSKFIDRKAS